MASSETKEKQGMRLFITTVLSNQNIGVKNLYLIMLSSIHFLHFFWIVEVYTARDKLSGALSHAIDKLGGEEGAHGFFGSPVKRLQRWVMIYL